MRRYGAYSMNLNIRQVIKNCYELIWPTSCVSCNRSQGLLCAYCRKNLFVIDQRSACKNCGAPFGNIVCTECSEAWEPDRVICTTAYDEISESIIKTYKDASEMRLATLIAEYLYENYLEVFGYTHRPHEVLSYIPASRSALRKRGFDHMKAIAQVFAQKLDLPCLLLLKKDDNKDQRALSKLQRKENMHGAFSPYLSDTHSYKRLLLIDDVITTGATVNEATRCLKAQGFEHVDVLAFARVW